MDALNPNSQDDGVQQHRQAADDNDEASFSESSESANTSATKLTGKKRKQLDKGSEEYRKRREKNNEAVKKSRIKSKAKTVETQDQENQLLNQKVASLTKEFELLKDLYQAHAKYAPSSEPAQEIDLTQLMAPDDPVTQRPQ